MRVRAWSTVRAAYRPSTQKTLRTHFSAFLSFCLFFNLQTSFKLDTLLCFLQLLSESKLSPAAIANYLSSLRAWAKLYHIPQCDLYHPHTSLFLKSVNTNASFKPKVKGYFTLEMLENISTSCQHSQDPLLFRAIFLVAFFAFLRISNIAPHSEAAFSPFKHLLRKNVIFAPPGAHIPIK